MDKKKERKILKELREKVFEKDSDIKRRHEIEELDKATKEALIEMTKLSPEEIDALESEVRQNIIRKNKQKTRLVLYLSLFTVLMIFMIWQISKINTFKEELVFHETFDNNQNQWDIFDKFEYNRYFEDGKYIFISNNEETCNNDALLMSLPKRFTVELTTTWISGRYHEYGPRFKLTFDDYYRFVGLQAKNKTFFSSDDPGYRAKPDLIPHESDFEVPPYKNIQKIIVRPRKWAGDPWVRDIDIHYYVNNKFIKTFTFSDIGTYDIKSDRGLKSSMMISVCGRQTVSFDYIKIVNDSNGKIIYDGNFEGLKEYFTPGMSARKLSKIEDGEYIFTSDTNEYCYGAVIPYKLKKYSKVSLKSRRLEGENYYYGMLIEQDQYNYYAFEIKQDGKACFIIRIDDVNEVYIDNLETGLNSVEDEEVLQTVVFKGGILEYYVNDRLVLKENRHFRNIKYIGFRVCGSQTVAFDDLKVWQ